MQTLDAPRAKRILLMQLAAALLIPLGALVHSPLAAASALVGGGIATVANAFFAAWMFGQYRAQDPQAIVLKMYGGELLKLVLIALVFIAVFVWMKPLILPAVLSAFLVVQILPPLIATRFGA